MNFTTLGRTEMRVSRVGLGCGGHSRLGLSRGATNEDAARIVREAIDLGINFVDTAETYGSEDAVGIGLVGIPRERVILSTKVGGTWAEDRATAQSLTTRLEGSLRRLRTDYADVYHLHGVRADQYTYATETLLPALDRLKEAGKIRAIGITEAFAPDPTHQMLAPAVLDLWWDVVMIGFNILNQSARERIMPFTQKSRAGTLCMFAVRRALSQPEALRNLIADMLSKGLIEGRDVDLDDPLGFLVADGVAGSITEAAYRFCLHEPGMDVVLTGTGNVDHLRENVRYLNGPPLPPEITARLKKMFQGVDSVSGN